ncbi:17879_t:CDS:2, partial [Gigaspora rosea]
FNKANPTFLVSEADFILRNWLASFCNSMDKCKRAYITDAKKECLIPTLLPVRRCNTSNIDIVSILDQDDINELTSHTQGSDSSIPIINIPKKKHINIESIFDQDDKNKIINRAQDSDTSINISNEDSDSKMLVKIIKMS